MLLSIPETITSPADSDQPLLNSRVINLSELNPEGPENSGAGKPILFQRLDP